MNGPSVQQARVVASGAHRGLNEPGATLPMSILGHLRIDIGSEPVVEKDQKRRAKKKIAIDNRLQNFHKTVEFGAAVLNAGCVLSSPT